MQLKKIKSIFVALGILLLKVKLSGLVFLAVMPLLVMSASQLFETNNAGYIKIRQMPVTGTLDIYSLPGMFGQYFGRVTEYKLAGTYRFANKLDDKRNTLYSTPVKVRFNDGGLAGISGTARFDLPLDVKKVRMIHEKFRSYTHLANGLIKPAIAESLILTASLMSAEESYSGRRAEFAQLAWDQLQHGVYITKHTYEEIANKQTGEVKQQRIVSIKMDAAGNPVRRQNTLHAYGIKINQFFLDKDFEYENGILTQISQQRDALMKTVSAKAEATKSQQDRITEEARGQAEVMKARYEAEVDRETAIIKARLEKEVAETEATARYEVAKKNRLAAAEYKEQQILIGMGDAQRKELILKADGALTQKLETYIQVQKAWANAYAQRKVPSLMMTGNSNPKGDSASLDFSNAMQLLVAKELGLDLGVSN